MPGYDVAAGYLPADGEAFTGDFYDLFEVDGSWWVAMGDVSGHGIHAATTTALARYTLRAEANHAHVAPSEVLARLHHILRSSTDGMQLLTVALSVLRPGPRTTLGSLCNAGHEPPLIRRASGAVEVAPAGGMLLGATDSVCLHGIAIELSPGDALVLITDGVTEARPGRGGELFDQQRLVQTLGASCDDRDASGMVEQIIGAVHRHSNGYLTDDIAVLALRVPTGDEQSRQ
jgi:serine phosphatase RsbU (regulator of sigma subunit)